MSAREIIMDNIQHAKTYMALSRDHYNKAVELRENQEKVASLALQNFMDWQAEVERSTKALAALNAQIPISEI